ncbi:MAG TPA: hypothetical protein PLU24_00620 [Candidatus Omnitrophota bacterium]|nr:hypothetical protein [Candidatus Omnitrophota bacterium]
MKADRVILVLVVVIMLASVVGSYFLFLKQDSLSGKKIDAVKSKVDSLTQRLKELDSQLQEFRAKQGDMDAVKKLEDRVSAVEAERADINTKITDLMKAVEEIKKGGAAPAVLEPVNVPAPEPQEAAVTGETPESNVDLGQIPVEK